MKRRILIMETALATVMNNENCQTAYAVPVTTKSDKIEMFNAMSNPTYKLGDYINSTITIKNISITPVDMINQNDEVVKLPRTVIIAQDGNSYTATSVGIYTSIKNIASVFGEELARGEIKVTIKQKTTRNGFKTLILEVVE